MKQYHEHLKAILEQGTWKDPAREGMPRSISLFGYQNRYDLQKGFPVLTTKKINFKHIITELLWFLRGDTNIKYLVDNGCNIWNEDAYNYYLKKVRNQTNKLSFERFIEIIKTSDNIKESGVLDVLNYNLGDCGRQYGWLWRKWEGQHFEDTTIIQTIDQLKDVIQSIKSNPEGRRHIITAWNPATLNDMALNACHAFVQFNCRKITWNNTNPKLIEYDLRQSAVEAKVQELGLPKYFLDCQLYQRSADMFLGVPYNISSYALLTHIIAKICNMEVGHFIHSFGDSHIYENHLDQVNEILSRDTEKYKLPILNLPNDDGVFKWKDILHPNLTPLFQNAFILENYESYPSIKATLSTGLK